MNDSRANNNNVADGFSMQIEPGQDHQDPVQVKAYLDKYFEQSRFKVYWGDVNGYPLPEQPDGRHDPPVDSATYREYRICRGGSFRDKPERLRCSARARVMAGSQHARRGFRVVRDLS